MQMEILGCLGRQFADPLERPRIDASISIPLLSRPGHALPDPTKRVGPGRDLQPFGLLLTAVSYTNLTLPTNSEV